MYLADLYSKTKNSVAHAATLCCCLVQSLCAPLKEVAGLQENVEDKLRNISQVNPPSPTPSPPDWNKNIPRLLINIH